MINLLLVVDDKDTDLGEYFDTSYKNLISQLEGLPDFNIKSIHNGYCSETNINEAIEAFSSTSFVFVSFTHGEENKLVTISDTLVSKQNINLFINSFVYTSACYTGIELGGLLVSNGCKCFIGYTDEVIIMPDYEETFIVCENWGITLFAKQKNTVGECFDSMKSKYDEKIDELLMLSDINATIAASMLVNNKEALTIIGDKDLTINDMMT